MSLNKGARPSRIKIFFQRLLWFLIALYSVCLAVYAITGPIQFKVLGVMIRLNDLFTLVTIFCLAWFFQILLALEWTRRRRVAAMVIVASLVGLGGASEIGLRLAYPREMSLTNYIHNPQAPNRKTSRGPYSAAPRDGSVTRILAQGGSVSWGDAVADWKELYPFKLMALLEKAPGIYDMQAWTAPYSRTDSHSGVLELEGNNISPDIIIYQWSPNDMEVWRQLSDDLRAPWQKGKVHKVLSRWSILYRWLDREIKEVFYQGGKEYARMIGDNYLPGGWGWWSFEQTFHKWATIANTLADRTILVTYPDLPYWGQYPFSKVVESVKALALPHVMKVPAASLPKRTGVEEEGLGSTYQKARVARKGALRPGILTFGPYMTMAGGAHEAIFNLKLLAPSPKVGRAALLEVISEGGRNILASRVVRSGDFSDPAKWESFSICFRVAPPIVHDIEFRIEWFGEVDLAVDTIDVPVFYRIELVDPMEKLNALETGSDMFDPYPGASAHSILAQILADHILNSNPVLPYNRPDHCIKGANKGEIMTNDAVVD
ncbi:MAG: hypothetical protein OEZ32_02840 [Nitrospinota bacterium]|nr:hypothetical protein [Nitrospinota bacterium]